MWMSQHKFGFVNLIHTITTTTQLSAVAAFTVSKVAVAQSDKPDN